jgi:hypothetical protein
MNQQKFRFVVQCPGCSNKLRYANSEILNSLLLRCPDCSHAFIAKCDGAKQISPINSWPSKPSPQEGLILNKPTIRSTNHASNRSQSKTFWKVALLVGSVLLLLGVVVPVVAIVAIAGSKSFGNRTSQNVNIPKADFSNRFKPPQTKNPTFPSSQKQNRSTNSMSQSSPDTETQPSPQRPRGKANPPDDSTPPTSRFEPPSMNLPKTDRPKMNLPNMDRPNMDRPNGSFDRPGFSPLGPNRPDGPTGFGPNPGMMLGPGGNSPPNPFLQDFDATNGVRIFITNAKGLKSREVVEKLKKDLEVSGHSARASGNEMSIELRFSGAIQKIVDRIDFGKVVELNQESRVIRIEANEP